MDIDLAALAASGASALVGSMATDAWHSIKREVAALFARHGAKLDEITESLDRAEVRSLSASDPRADDAILAPISAQLTVWLYDYPNVVQEFAQYIATIDNASKPSGTYMLSAKAKGNARIIQQGHGTQING